MYKVKRYFLDAETGKAYDEGDTFEGRPERVQELQDAGLIGKTPVKAEPVKGSDKKA